MNDKPAMANTQAFAVITQDELSSLRAELAELRARVAVPDDVAKDALEDLADTVSLALSKAWSLGQTYWSQADSESYKQNKKAAEMRAERLTKTGSRKFWR